MGEQNGFLIDNYRKSNPYAYKEGNITPIKNIHNAFYVFATEQIRFALTEGCPLDWNETRRIVCLNRGKGRYIEEPRLPPVRQTKKAKG